MLRTAYTKSTKAASPIKDYDARTNELYSLDGLKYEIRRINANEFMLK